MQQHVLFVTNPEHTSEGFAYVHSRFAQAAAARDDVRLEHVTVDEAVVRVTSYGAKPDAAIFWDKDTATARLMESFNVRCFNAPGAIDTCENKLATFFVLQRAGVPQPETLPIPRNPLSMRHDTTDRWQMSPFIDAAIAELDLPLVGKPVTGSFGTNVALLNTREELVAYCTKFDRFYPGLVQRYSPSKDNSDVRVIVVGGRAVAAMRRVSPNGDFRANLALGGLAQQVELNAIDRRVAEEAALVVGADFVGVDLLRAGTKRPLVCEVNSHPQFTGVEAACGIDFPGLVLDYVARALG